MQNLDQLIVEREDKPRSIDADILRFRPIPYFRRSLLEGKALIFRSDGYYRLRSVSGFNKVSLCVKVQHNVSDMVIN